MAMAINFNSSAQIPIQKYGSLIKYANKELMYKHRHAPQKKALIGPVVLRIRASSIKNKVYEDQSEGIICYQDESGEIICEGYDEGPTYRQITRPTHRTRSFAELRDAEIISLLQKRWIEIVKGEEIDDDAVEDAHLLQEKFELQ